MSRSKIEWTEMTWNPVTGCTKVSSGCKNCYAEVFAKRLYAMGSHKYRNAFRLTLHPEALLEPYKWKKPRMIFVNSMSDLFHEDVPIAFIEEVFQVMRDNPAHIFQVLTKRAEILCEYDKHGYIEWTPNIWMGVSVENEKVLGRVDFLRRTGAHVKFISCEPLVGPIPNLNLRNIDWVIVGGESGHRARPMKLEWVQDLKNQCLDAGVPFFFKQWGGVNKKRAGRQLDGQTWDGMPEAIVACS